MKKIEAKIRKSKFKAVKRSLVEAGFESFNYHLTRSISKNSEKRFYRGVAFDSKATERIDLSIYVKNNDIEKVLDIIRESGVTGDAKDAYICVFGVEQSYVLGHVDGKDKLIHI
jgi:nitrogen regulatory protein P-II 1